MKKSFLILIATITVLTFLIYNCSKDNTTKVSKITGTVTYNTSSNALGAIVILSSDKMAAKIITRVVADSSGIYSITGLSNGTFYLSAKYVTGNSNLKSAGNGITFVTDSAIVVTVNGADVKQNINLANTSGSGQDQVILSSLTKQWSLDEVHSRVGFSFPYDSVSANFYGIFINFGLNSFTFDQANLAGSSFSAWVDVTSTETGAPTIVMNNNNIKTDTMIGGRDGIDGCIAKSEFQVKPTFIDSFPHEYINKLGHDTTVYYKYHPAASIIDKTSSIDGSLIPSAKATFISSSITAYGDGYVAAGSFTFHSITKNNVNLYFHYIKSPAKPTEASFSGFFDFKPTLDYKMPRSGHVANNSVNMNVNLVFTKNP